MIGLWLFVRKVELPVIWPLTLHQKPYRYSSWDNKHLYASPPRQPDQQKEKKKKLEVLVFRNLTANDNFFFNFSATP